MLSYQVESLRTGVYILPSGADRQTLSVSGNQQVTLHCAGDLTSDPFPFDKVVYAPFHNTLYSMCVADDVRAQFGAAVQRPAAAYRRAPRRATIFHGDPATHSANAFYQVVRLAAEEVERLSGAHHAGSPYECVFNVARVYPWGEKDLLGEALRMGNEGTTPDVAALPPAPALSKPKATAPLQTPAQRRLFVKVLKQLCEMLDDERREASACVHQVRLAVYTRCFCGDVANSERVLCAEHLFSLMPSVCDVCTSFGTSMEALCEVLLCRRAGNLLDNPLLPLLLPGAAIEGLSVVTCISAKGRYASRPCIDACCFGCSSGRQQRAAKMNQLLLECEPTQHERRASGGRDLLSPPTAPSFTSPFQKMTSELLLSTASRSGHTTPESASRRTSVSIAPPPIVFPKRSLATSMVSPNRSGHYQSSRLSCLDASVDRILAQHQLDQSPAKSLKSHASSSVSIGPRGNLGGRLPFSPYDLRKYKERVARQAEEALLDRVKEAEKRADAAVETAREKAANAQRLETDALERSREVQGKIGQMRHAYATEKAALLIRQKVLQLSCADLGAQEQRLVDAVEERWCAAEELERAAQQLTVVEPRLRCVRAEEQQRSQCVELQLRYVECISDVCREYACAVADKVAQLDIYAHSLAEEVHCVAWEARLSELQQQCTLQEARLAELEEQSRTELRRVGDLRREEGHLTGSLDELRINCTRLQSSVEQLERRCADQQQRIASDLREAADAQERAVRDYDNSIEVLRRLKGEQQDLRKRRDELRADCEQQQSLCDAAREELAGLRSTTEELRVHLEQLEVSRSVVKAELEQLRGAEALATEQACVNSANGVVVDELRQVIEELADATDELAEVEDVMIEETDKALLAFRRCDGEMTVRVERLLDRCASFMDVESRIASRSSSNMPGLPMRCLHGGASWWPLRECTEL
ncbi:hypothetical protein ABL78_6587 [Leptomonas seymouri]|uniref:Uncharacterized protein n=1 Tax=Leptomonas seymouri TaxID=5684 RepID=A0A0N1I347_LEPSE|nr:hypothetical protein ABL78_6587 [Leptomonas seymouri]|eukprot:KPI84358.1 hypothetical protein ABL78_6587 [Leptomonas seymouri]